MSNSLLVSYIEVDIVALVILMVLFINISYRTVYFKNEILYKVLIILIVMSILADIFAIVTETMTYSGAVALNYIADCVYFIGTLMVAYVFLGYIISVVHPQMTMFNYRMQLIFIPMYIFTVMTIASVKTGWIFTISEQNVYSRGEYHFLHPLISAIILSVAFFYALYHLRKGNMPADIGLYLVLLPLFPLGGVVLRHFLPSSNVIWVTCAIGMFLIFNSGQNSMIVVDSLTRLNNRSRADQYVDYKYEKLQPGKRLYLAMMDLNHFKEINDMFGHHVGDEALKEFAQILKDVCKGKDLFIARLGGDEFLLLAEKEERESIDRELMELKQKLQQVNADTKRSYKLICSIGVASVSYEGKAHMTVDKLRIRADHKMYEDKEKFHEHNISVINTSYGL
ncbi:GGDEF domain-containing protein [Eubacterium oxidoreducens]|uniref:Diguanylate cyclase (GGDEF) domain-containing protein n=1 Tax=Eubacterium oxidoreducens TaxID=1732 RepID=A0A1G6AG80_EUBOX|nr:GGDEF domain-containing protein [Eubacterium oxidoreducens]SDB07093.1 diguanylate cyclase (GGDEF) domain-containing protein [Eubacterium oxidoreducens]